MSYTNGTTHYNLPLTTGADKRDWSDTNQAFSDVDAALYGAVQDTAQAELDIDALETRMDTAEQNISTNTGNIAGLDTRVTTVEGAITSLSGQVTDTRQDLEDMICAYNEASATSTHAYAIGDYFIYNDVLYKATQVIAIGDTIVPDTNCVTTNVTTELLATENLSDDVTQLQTDVGTLQSDVEAITPRILYNYDSGVATTAAFLIPYITAALNDVQSLTDLTRLSLLLNDKFLRLNRRESSTAYEFVAFVYPYGGTGSITHDVIGLSSGSAFYGTYDLSGTYFDHINDPIINYCRLIIG